MHRLFAAWLLVSGVLVVGCSSSSSDDAPKGRGSAACQKWQSTLCGWAKKCGVSAAQVAQCNEQARGVTCKSDELANSCTATLQSDSCSTAAVGCDIRDLADPAAAETACAGYLDAVCTSVERCGGATKADCLADPALAAVCPGAIAYTLDYEACLSQIKTVSCTAETLPAICTGVILK